MQKWLSINPRVWIVTFGDLCHYDLLVKHRFLYLKQIQNIQTVIIKGKYHLIVVYFGIENACESEISESINEK